jgi:ABC-type molybdate transport system substrate-binding protein
LATCFAATAWGAEITVVTPGFVIGGMRTLAASYQAKTGNKVTVSGQGMGSMMSTIKARGDVVVLPADLMQTAIRQGLVSADTRQPLGRVEIVMIVPKGAPHPDISTVAKTAAAIKSAKRVAYSNPFTAENSKQAMIIHNILQRPDFQPNNGKPPAKGNAVVGIKEGADMGLQLHSQIDDPAVEDVGPLPVSLGAFMDGDVVVSARAGADRKTAQDFIHYILADAATPTWKSHGVDRK